MTINRHRLRRLRLKAALSVTGLAAKAGLTKSLISMLETGYRTNPTAATLNALAKALGCEIEDLLPAEPKERAA